MKISICMVAAMAAGLAFGAPSATVDSVTVAEGAPVGATVTYTLSAKAVVTAEILDRPVALRRQYGTDPHPDRR